MLLKRLHLEECCLSLANVINLPNLLKYGLGLRICERMRVTKNRRMDISEISKWLTIAIMVEIIKCFIDI